MRPPTLTPLLCGLLAACTAAAPVHIAERFDPQSPYLRFFRTTPDAACEAGQRTLMGQGYVVERPRPEAIQATKFFQPDAEHSTTLQLSLVCAASGGGSVIYANAREQRYALKAGGASAGLSVAGLGSISLPWSGTNENLVKVGEATVSDPEFYARFFTLVEVEIP